MPEFLWRAVLSVVLLFIGGIVLLGIAMSDRGDSHYNADGLPRDGDAATPERRARLRQLQRRFRV